jgi:hypothetical protein
LHVYGCIALIYDGLVLGLISDSSVGTVTGLWTACLKSRDSVPGMGTKASSPAVWPTTALVQWVLWAVCLRWIGRKE